MIDGILCLHDRDGQAGDATLAGGICPTAAQRAGMFGGKAGVQLLWLCYFVQGLPFGFQSKSLPLLLKEQGYTLRQIGYANVL